LYFPYTSPIRKQVLINLTTGRKASFNLDALDDIYAEIQTVNITMARRLRTVCQEDSLINALIL